MKIVRANNLQLLDIKSMAHDAPPEPAAPAKKAPAKKAEPASGGGSAADPMV